MTPNLDLIERTLQRIEARPELFDMLTFGEKRGECGTVACFAGHAMLVSGYALSASYLYYRPDGTCVDDIESEAADLLGFGRPRALRLFYALIRTPAQLRDLVEDEIGPWIRSTASPPWSANAPTRSARRASGQRRRRIRRGMGTSDTRREGEGAPFVFSHRP